MPRIFSVSDDFDINSSCHFLLFQQVFVYTNIIHIHIRKFSKYGSIFLKMIIKIWYQYHNGMTWSSLYQENLCILFFYFTKDFFNFRKNKFCKFIDVKHVVENLFKSSTSNIYPISLNIFFLTNSFLIT